MMFEGNRLYYRSIAEADTDLVLRWRNSDYVRKHFIYRNLITREDHFRWLHNQVEMGNVIQFLMYEKKSNQPIGSVYLRDVDYIKRTAEYGIFIGEGEYRGCGYGTEAAKDMIAYAFDQLRLESLILRVLADNKQAIRSYENAGFILDEQNEQYILIDGKEEQVLFMRICTRGRMDG